tara:strand:+ start:121 stop:369 length:249 start_codon:yes stop_codon:yes gene_type:complete
MKITLTPYAGGTKTAETPSDGLDSIALLLRGLLIEAGYHPKMVNKMFSKDLQNAWFESAIEKSDIFIFSEKYLRENPHLIKK